MRVEYTSGSFFTLGVDWLDIDELNFDVKEFKILEGENLLTDEYTKPSDIELELLDGENIIYKTIENSPNLDLVNITREQNLNWEKEYKLRYRVKGSYYGYGDWIEENITRTMTKEVKADLDKLNSFSKTNHTHMYDLVEDYKLNLENYLESYGKFNLVDRSSEIKYDKRRLTSTRTRQWNNGYNFHDIVVFFNQTLLGTEYINTKYFKTFNLNDATEKYVVDNNIDYFILKNYILTSSNKTFLTTVDVKKECKRTCVYWNKWHVNYSLTNPTWGYAALMCLNRQAWYFHPYMVTEPAWGDAGLYIDWGGGSIDYTSPIEPIEDFCFYGTSMWSIPGAFNTVYSAIVSSVHGISFEINI